MKGLSVHRKEQRSSWINTIPEKNIAFIHVYICEARNSMRLACLLLNSRYNMSLFDIIHFYYPWPVTTVLCTKLARKVLNSQMCTFDKCQFNYNLLLFTPFLLMTVYVDSRPRVNARLVHYKKGPSNVSDMGPWAHTLVLLGNSLYTCVDLDLWLTYVTCWYYFEVLYDTIVYKSLTSYTHFKHIQYILAEQQPVNMKCLEPWNTLKTIGNCA